MYSERFEVKVWMPKGSVQSHFLFAFMVNVINEYAKDHVLSFCMFMILS